MKYTIELDSPDMRQAIASMNSQLSRMIETRSALGRMYGKGSDTCVGYGRLVDSLRRALTAFVVAADEAEPERATGTFEGSLQVGDEMPFVYGRPRNDPREAPRRKRSNIRR